MWLNAIFYIILFLPTVVRWLLWLAIFQQKEYRSDRIKAYLETSQGKKDLVKIIPLVSQLNRTGLKRPKRTLRIGLLSFISSSLLFLPPLFFLSLNPVIFLLMMLAILILIPVIIFITNLPLNLLKTFVTLLLLSMAKRKIASTKPTIIGITGSYAKTSTKHLLTHLLSSKTKVFTTQRSLNTPLSLSIDILRRYQNEPMVVLEYAAYKPGEIKRLAKIFQPHAAIITGFAPQHLSIFGSREGIVKAKAELIMALPSGSDVFFNQADSGVTNIIKYAVDHSQNKEFSFIPFVDKGNALKYSKFEIDSKGKLKFKLNNNLVNTQLVGKQYASVVQGAAVAAKNFKLTDHQIIANLKTFEPQENYVKFFRHEQGFWVIDDGRTANPAGFKAALSLMEQLSKKRQLTGKRVIFTAGIIDLGDESEAVHQQLATIAKEIATDVVYLGDPGKEQFQKAFNNHLLTNNSDIQSLLSLLTVNDLILVEGRLPIWLANFLEIKQ